jgi:hypothetical protein
MGPERARQAPEKFKLSQYRPRIGENGFYNLGGRSPGTSRSTGWRRTLDRGRALEKKSIFSRRTG